MVAPVIAHRLRRAVVSVVLAGALGGAWGNAEAAPAPPARTNLADIEREVMCPTCGTPLMVADSPLAERERVFIRARIARGETKDQIKRDMVAQFGPAILASPPAHGFSLTAYLIPAAAIASALLGLGFGLRRWRQPRTPSRADVPAPLASLLARKLEDDMARYDL